VRQPRPWWQSEARKGCKLVRQGSAKECSVGFIRTKQDGWLWLCGRLFSSHQRGFESPWGRFSKSATEIPQPFI
jgi:hypothetical protein